MRIGLVADTHVPVAARGVPPEVAEAFRGVDLILHAGDIYDVSVLEALERVAPVLAALGDDDSYSLLKDERVKERHELTLDGYSLWLMHERPFFYRLSRLQKGPLPDIVVHGHTHVAEVWRDDDTLVVGSGSPTFLNYHRGLGTVAVLDIGPEGPQASIIKL